MEGPYEGCGSLRSQAERQPSTMMPTHRPWLNQSLRPQFPRIGSAPAFFGNHDQRQLQSPVGLSTPQSRPAQSGQASPHFGTFCTFNNQIANMSGTIHGTSEASRSGNRTPQRMGTMRNRHGDSVVAMDTPDGSMAVELTRSRLNGSSRHAVMTASLRGSCRSRSQRSRGQDRRSARISFSSDSECSLPEVAIHHHSLGGSNGSR